MTIVVRKATAADESSLAAALALAFHDDPVMSWLLPQDRSRVRRLRALFRVELRYLHLPHNEVYTNAEVSSGALWAPPGRWRTPPVSLVRSIPRLVLSLGLGITTALRSIKAIERVHPHEPHWYLAVLGTEPSWQGKGVGSALLGPVLQRCDRDGTGAYLESSKESNVPFYARHGFEVTRPVDLPHRGPRIWPMWRDPRP
jgi:ribosomal protein S18 acetylase RimI-like enzyme